MRIRLVFWDWTRRGLTAQDKETCEASMGDFHGGTLFRGELELDPEQEEDLRHSLSLGLEPVFVVSEERDDEL